MSGRKKEGNAPAGVKAVREQSRSTIDRPAICRIARRGGFRGKFDSVFYMKTISSLELFLKDVLRDAVSFTEKARRNTVTALDVINALKRRKKL
jgi:histone H4